MGFMCIVTCVTLGLAALLVIVLNMMVIISAREVGIKERLGKFQKVLEPGFHLLVPIIDRVRYRHEMREQVADVPMQTCITRDNIQVRVDGDVYFKVVDPEKASYGIADFTSGVVHLAMTTMRSEIGKLPLDTAFAEREAINESIVREIDEASDAWGVKVLRYEVETVEPGAHVIQTLEQQMEAERAKRADITLADGERVSRTNQAEGERQEAINVSMGERERRINEAEGRARAIAIEAEATAKALARVAEALRRPGGQTAARLQILDQFIQRLGQVLEGAQVTVVPTEIAKVKTVFEGVGQVTGALPQTAGPRRSS